MDPTKRTCPNEWTSQKLSIMNQVFGSHFYHAFSDSLVSCLLFLESIRPWVLCPLHHLCSPSFFVVFFMFVISLEVVMSILVFVIFMFSFNSCTSVIFSCLFLLPFVFVYMFDACRLCILYPLINFGLRPQW